MGQTEVGRPGGRKIERPVCPVDHGGERVWQVRGYEQARAVLRGGGCVQAGFARESVDAMPARIRRPVLHLDGQEHREVRRQTARYFTPKRVDQHYRAVMVDVAEQQLAALRRRGTAQLGELSFNLAIQVVSAVLGLSGSRPGIRERLERYFPERYVTPGFTSWSGLTAFARNNANLARVYLADVRPAVRARRRDPRDDLISHLLAEGCSDTEILIECVTFAGAGMITTREFINLAAWHLFTDPVLLKRYRAGDEAARTGVLHEILRLEPVVGRLRRRAVAPLTVPGPDGVLEVPAGGLVDLFIADANLDERAVGPRAAEVYPGRALADGAAPAGLSFGDGPHKCPGAAIAILETDVFLDRMFDLPGIRMLTAPRVSFKDEIASYELRDLTVAIDPVAIDPVAIDLGQSL